jgi:hypothetical protein
MFDAKTSGKAALIVAALGAFLLLGGVPQLHANDRREKCDKYIYKARKNVGKQIRQHGEHSWQAEQARRRLEETRRNCGEYGYDRDRDRDRDRNHRRDYDRDHHHDRDHDHDHDHDHH